MWGFYYNHFHCASSYKLLRIKIVNFFKIFNLIFKLFFISLSLFKPKFASSCVYIIFWRVGLKVKWPKIKMDDNIDSDFKISYKKFTLPPRIFFQFYRWPFPSVFQNSIMVSKFISLFFHSFSTRKERNSLYFSLKRKSHCFNHKNGWN